VEPAVEQEHAQQSDLVSSLERCPSDLLLKQTYQNQDQQEQQVSTQLGLVWRGLLPAVTVASGAAREGILADS
jgi:hypothetical protein